VTWSGVTAGAAKDLAVPRNSRRNRGLTATQPAVPPGGSGGQVLVVARSPTIVIAYRPGVSARVYLFEQQRFRPVSSSLPLEGGG
jgi:hypothetical protein